MLTRVQGRLAAVIVTAIAAAAVIVDLSDGDARDWWNDRALTADVVAGLLVLSITLLVVDQLVSRREFSDRSRAVGAQVAIVMAQASRASEAVSSALEGSGDRATALDEVRTYMMMLLVTAPLLVEPAVSRLFLEQAQQLGAEMARVAALAKGTHAGTISRRRIDDALTQLRSAAAPLLQPLDLEGFFAADPVDDRCAPGS